MGSIRSVLLWRARGALVSETQVLEKGEEAAWMLEMLHYWLGADCASRKHSRFYVVALLPPAECATRGWHCELENRGYYCSDAL